HTRFSRDWSSDVCSSDLYPHLALISDGVKRHLMRVRQVKIYTLIRVQRRFTGSAVNQTHLLGPQVQTAPQDQAQNAARGDVSPEIGRASCRERGKSGGGT